MNLTSTPKAGRREWIGLAVLVLPCLLYSMDLTVLNLALPALSTEFKPSSVELLWIVDIYGFLVAGSLILMGTLGDRIGRRKLLLIGATTFGLASLLAAFSTSAPMLIASRALLGIAGATVAPSTLSLIRNMFHDPAERMTAIGIWGTGYAAGGAIGPLIGGVLLEHFWWGSVFLIGVPVMLLLLAVGPFLLPEFRDPNAGRLDLTSAAMSLVAVLAVIYGLKEMAHAGLNLLPIFSILVGLGVGYLFVRRQRTLADPFLDLRLFANRSFSVAVITNTVGVFVAFGGFLYIAQFMQLVLGLSPLQAGLWSLPGAIAVVITSNVAPVLARRIHPAYLVATGLVLAAIGYGLLTQVSGDFALAAIVIGNIVMSTGFGLTFVLTADIVVSAAPVERAGAASAISETGSEFGGAMGIAILGSLGTAVYRNMMTVSIPAGVPADAAEAARDTLGGAVAVAAELPANVGNALLNASHAAFAQGLQLTAIIAAAVMVVSAILAVTMLRHVPAGNAHGEEPQAESDNLIASGPQLEPALVPITCDEA
jgi:DHA2 family multidrug resistance protein-like MFS transporter